MRGPTFESCELREGEVIRASEAREATDEGLARGGDFLVISDA